MYDEVIAWVITGFVVVSTAMTYIWFLFMLVNTNPCVFFVLTNSVSLRFQAAIPTQACNCTCFWNFGIVQALMPSMAVGISVGEICGHEQERLRGAL